MIGAATIRDCVRHNNCTPFLTTRARGTDSRNYGYSLEIVHAGGTGTRVCRAPELSSIAALLQTADVFSLHHANQRTASRNSGSDRIHDAREAFYTPILDAVGVGQRQGVDGVRYESAARRRDEENRSAYGQNKFLALEAAERGNPAALGRRDAPREIERLNRSSELGWAVSRRNCEKTAGKGAGATKKSFAEES